jgi:hypothetical protein
MAVPSSPVLIADSKEVAVCLHKQEICLEGRHLAATGTIYRRWDAGRPVDYCFVLDIVVGVGQQETRASRVIARIEDGGYRSFEDAKRAIENAGIDGIVVAETPQFDDVRIDQSGFEEVAGVQLIYRPGEVVKLRSRAPCLS